MEPRKKQSKPRTVCSNATASFISWKKRILRNSGTESTEISWSSTSPNVCNSHGSRRAWLRFDRLSSGPEGKTLEVILDNRLNTRTFTEHCSCYHNFAKPRTGLLGAQRPRHQGKLLIILLYLALVRLHLKYCIEFWAPELNKDVEKLKRAQQKGYRERQGLEHVFKRGGWGIRSGFVW